MEKDNIVKTVSKNSLFTVIFNIWYLGSRLLMTPLILANISIQEYGLWSYCFVILSYLALGAFGFNNTYIRFTADFRSRDENIKLNQLLSTGLISMILFSIALFTLFYFLITPLIGILGIDPHLHETAKGLLIGTAAIFVMNFTISGYQNILEGEQRIALVRTIHLIASVLEIILIIVFFQLGFGVYSLLWAYGIRFSFIMFLNMFYAHKIFPFIHVSIRNFRMDALKKFLGYGNQMNALGFLTLLINSVDRIFITRILHLEAAGLYEIGRKLPNIGLMLPSSVAGTMMPAASHLEGSSQHHRLNNIYLSSTRYLILLSSIPYAFMIIFAPWIIKVWVGDGFSQSILVMQILAVGTLINLFTGIGTAFVRGIGKPIYEIHYMIISTVFILILTPFLTIHIGIVGAALAYSIAISIGSLYFLFRANKLFEISWSKFLQQTLPPAGLMFISCIITYILCSFLWQLGASSRWLGLGILVITLIVYICISIAGIVLFKSFILTPQERNRISDMAMPDLFNTLWKRLWKPA